MTTMKTLTTAMTTGPTFTAKMTRRPADESFYTGAMTQTGQSQDIDGMSEEIEGGAGDTNQLQKGRTGV